MTCKGHLAPALRQHGIAAGSDREGKARTRTWQITKLSSATSATSATSADLGKQADDKADDSGKADDGRTITSAATSATFPQVDSHFDPLAEVADAETPENFYGPGGWPPGSIGAAVNPVRNVRCPACRWRFETAVQPGEDAWCKMCGHTFTVPGKDA